MIVRKRDLFISIKEEGKILKHDIMHRKKVLTKYLWIFLEFKKFKLELGIFKKVNTEHFNDLSAVLWFGGFCFSMKELTYCSIEEFLFVHIGNNFSAWRQTFTFFFSVSLANNTYHGFSHKTMFFRTFF